MALAQQRADTGNMNIMPLFFFSLGLTVLQLKFYSNSNFSFLIYICTGRTQQQIPLLRQCPSLAEIFMKLFSTILFFLISSIACGQSLNFAQIKTASIDSLRRASNAKFIKYDYTIGVSEDYFPNATKFKLAQPIIIKGSYKDFNNETSFYFSKSDSIVRLIEYQWDVVEESFDSVYYKIVYKNKEYISSYFHFEPVEIHETDVKAAKSIWENNSVYVQQLIMPGLNRIRVLVSWK